MENYFLSIIYLIGLFSLFAIAAFVEWLFDLY